jgi:hypothetical protein
MVSAGTVREGSSMSIRRTRSLLGLTLLAALACASAPGQGPEAAPAGVVTKPTVAWDQAAVTSLGGELATACVALYNEYYRTPGSSGGQIGTGESQDAIRLKQKLRRLQEQSQDLAGGLASGKGRVDTLPDMEDIGELARDIRVLLQRMFIQSPLQARIDQARSVWLKLMPYYGIQPPPPRTS